MRTLPRSYRLPIALVVVMSLVLPLPAAGAPAPLPNWDVDKTGKKPADKPADTSGKPTAPLPDWGVTGKPKPDGKGKGKPGKPGKGKSGKPAPTPDEPTEPTEPTEPDEVAPTPGEPAPEPTAAQPATPEERVGPEPEPTVTKPADDTAAAERLRLRGRAEMITGAVFMVGGLTGFGVLGAGAVLKGRAEQDLDQQKQGETMLAAGAVAGVLGMALGIALVAAGGRDMKAGRAGLTSRVRIAPTFGGLVISGRF